MCPGMNWLQKQSTLLFWTAMRSEVTMMEAILETVEALPPEMQIEVLNAEDKVTAGAVAGGGVNKSSF